jgi:hypothetical protein
VIAVALVALGGGDPILLALAMMAVAVISFVAVLALPETRGSTSPRCPPSPSEGRSTVALTDQGTA